MPKSTGTRGVMTKVGLLVSFQYQCFIRMYLNKLPCTAICDILHGLYLLWGSSIGLSRYESPVEKLKGPFNTHYGSSKMHIIVCDMAVA